MNCLLEVVVVVKVVGRRVVVIVVEDSFVVGDEAGFVASFERTNQRCPHSTSIFICFE